MEHVRPYKLFRQLGPPPSNRIAQIQIPQHRGAGGLTMLETILLVAAARIVSTYRAFEFGTFHGTTTLNIALNVPPGGEVFTLDLGENCVQNDRQDMADAPLTKIHLAAKSDLDFQGSAVREKIKTLTGNSRTFDFSTYKRSMDFVLIDGGHDLDTVASDTENAFSMVSLGKPSCVMWHDYGNPAYGPLTEYLEELSKERKIVHFGDTMLCAWFNDPDNSITPGFSQA